MKTLSRSNRLPVITVIFTLALTGCRTPIDKSEDLTARAWKFPPYEPQKSRASHALARSSSSSDFKTATLLTTAKHHLPPVGFPERDLDQIRTKKNVGLAFSGGGNLAAVSALGQVRALRELGLLKQVRYISCVSGGSWFSVPFTFYSGSLDKFLGDYVPPENLTWKGQIDLDPRKGSFAYCAAHAEMKPWETLFDFKYGNEKYAHRLNEIYLKPFGPLGDPHKFFCLDKNTMKEILKRNSERNSKLAEDDFIVAHPERPFLIANAVVCRKSWFQSPSDRYVPFEMTPLYSGSAAFRQPSFWFYDVAVGGGFVESFAFDSYRRPYWTPVGSQGREWQGPVRLPAPMFWETHQSPRFSISDVMAASGAAPTVLWPDAAWTPSFPQFNQWSPQNLPDAKFAELIHTDGGSIDNTGMISLLGRGVKTIVAFVNSDTTIAKGGNSMQATRGKRIVKNAEGTPVFPDSVTALFQNSYRDDFSSHFRSQVCQVFKTDELHQLKEQFEQKWQTGGPLIFDQSYETVLNEHYCIKAGQHVRIIWVFLGPNADISAKQSQSELPRGRLGSCVEWVRTLSPDSYSHITQDPATLKEFRHFPNFKVFFENKEIVYLSQRQVNALSQFTSYGIMRNRDVFLDALSGH